jgi:NAD(P)H-hydrate epimerase
VSLIIDALLGYNISGNPKSNTKKLIEWAMYLKKNFKIPILSLDLPSGIDPDGTIYEPTISATTTLTLALPKEGMFNNKIKKYFGNLYLADISVPSELYKNELFNFNVENVFNESDIIQIY